MLAVLDGHVAAEAAHDVDRIMAAFRPDATRGHPSGHVLTGHDAIRAHYEAAKPPGEVKVDRVRSIVDAARQEVADEYLVTITLPHGQKVAFPVLAVVTFEDGLIKTQSAWYQDGLRPADVLTAGAAPSPGSS